MTVLDIVGEGLSIRGETQGTVRDKVATWLERVGLNADHMSRYPHEFLAANANASASHVR